jgi:septal ring factor EnvC (AmiA/AmiB activator)
MISKVTKESPAEKGGLEVGDILIRAGEKELTDVESLRTALRELRDGEKILLQYFRDKKAAKIEIMPAGPEKTAEMPLALLESLDDVLSRENILIFRDSMRENSEKVKQELQRLKEELERQKAKSEAQKKNLDSEKRKLEEQKRKLEAEKKAQEELQRQLEEDEGNARI